MKRLALFLLVALYFPATAHADDASKHAKVHQMLDLIHVDRLMAQMMDGAMKQMNQITGQMLGNNLTDEQKTRLTTFQKQIMDFMNQQIGWKAMEPEYIELYSQTFTEEELDGIIAFYKTPAGASMIAKTPELTQKSMAMVQQKMIALQPALQQMIQDFVKNNPKPAPASSN